MIRVLVMANDSVLAEAIESVLTEESDLDVLRVTRSEPGKVDQAMRDRRSVVVIVEEGGDEEVSLPARDLFRDYDRVRILTISPARHHLHICESYHVPVSGMEQVVTLVRDSAKFKVESGGDP